MDVLYSLPSTPKAAACALTFGNFDGVHLGHRALLTQVLQAGAGLPGPTTVVTFEPHPLQLLQPDRAPRAIDPLSTRLALLADAGVQRAVVLSFDRALAAVTALDFAQRILVQCLGAQHVVCGPDVRFGHGGAGDSTLLKAILADVGGDVQTHAGVAVAGEAVSSSRVRSAVARGDVALAAQLLTRPFCLHGQVVTGDQRGRTLGFATANLLCERQVVPAVGVYASRAKVAGVWKPAVTNVGWRPTFNGQDLRIETHISDFEQDIYGSELVVSLHQWLRGEQRFADLGALKDQIHRDVAAARACAWFKELP